MNMGHPGYCETSMVTGSQAAMGPVVGKLLNAVAHVVAYSPEEGALTPVGATAGSGGCFQFSPVAPW